MLYSDFVVACLIWVRVMCVDTDAFESHIQALFKTILKDTYPSMPVDESMVDLFIKNTHHVKVLRGRKWGALEEDKSALGTLQHPQTNTKKDCS